MKIVNMQTWTTIDKTDWPVRGPWDSEPDKAQWIDEATGLDCLIVRQGNSGHLCGYVGLPPEHPWHGIDYDGCTKTPPCEESWCNHGPDARVEVHGGLTFAARCQEHAEPGTGICHIPEPGRPADVWWLGFDCAHAWDMSPGRGYDFGEERENYKTFGYVQDEVTRLAAQLAEAAS
jgi:hypothetical protein